MSTELNDYVVISPGGTVDGTIRPPGSKSITNRAILCAALGRGQSRLTGVLDSEDTRVMINAWKQLGVDIEHDPDQATAAITGCAGVIPNHRADIHVANSGTSIRFLCAALATGKGEFRLDGIERMRQRPIGDLVRALNQLGAAVHSENPHHPDCPPVVVHADGLQGGRAEVAGNLSSQFLSALMMAAPLAREAVTLEITGELVSVPYVLMTAEIMRQFGIDLSTDLPHTIHVPAPQHYVGRDYEIEPDASAASYFWAAAAITGGRARIEGLHADSLQGDVQFCRVLEQMGCQVRWLPEAIEVIGPARKGVDVDMCHISDTVQTLAVVSLFVDGPTTVRGVAHNRVKETDRITDLAMELRKFGAEVDEYPDGLRIVPPENPQPATIQTYNDHRMAMSMALAGLKIPGVVIENPGCTRKTYPRYWHDLRLFTGCRLDHG